MRALQNVNSLVFTWEIRQLHKKKLYLKTHLEIFISEINYIILMKPLVHNSSNL